MKVTFNFKKETKMQELIEILRKLSQVDSIQEIQLSTAFGDRSNITFSKMFLGGTFG